MVDLLQNSTRNRFQTAVWSVKLGFLFVGAISVVLLLKLAVPYSVNAVLSTIPRIWISFRSWLAPPYLYIIVNFIIITIAASSSFQQKQNSEKKMDETVTAENQNRLQKQKRNDFGTVSSSTLASDHRKTEIEIWSEMNEIPQDSVQKASISIGKSAESSSVTSSDVSCLTDSDEKGKADFSVSSRFAFKISSENSRKIGKSVTAPQKTVKPLSVAKTNKQKETLDATWKMITDGKEKPLTRHLKKSETWDVPPRVIDPESDLDSSLVAINRKELRKSETFNDASSSASSASSTSSRSSDGGGGLTRDKSLSHDELNRRVEAFIKKFNDDIRLQRQESFKRYADMVNRGVY